MLIDGSAISSVHPHEPTPCSAPTDASRQTRTCVPGGLNCATEPLTVESLLRGLVSLGLRAGHQPSGGIRRRIAPSARAERRLKMMEG